MRRGKLKIGFVFDDSLDRNDGVQQYVKTLANWLHSQGHTIHYFVGETKDPVGYPGYVHSLSKNMTVSGNQNRLSIPLPASGKKIDELLKSLKPDVLHVQMPFSPLLGAKVINRASNNTAVFATFHIVGERFTERYGSKVLRLATNKANKRLDKVFAVSEPAQNYAKEHYKVDSEIMPNVVDLSRYHAAKGKRQTRPTILFLGRLVERKGVHHLLAGVANVRDQLLKLNARVLIAGDGPLRPKLNELVERFNLGDLVHFLGYVDEQNKPDLIASADLAVFPSTGGESFGIVLIEAMATNGPVVLAGDNPGYHSVVGKQFQMMVDPNDDVALGKQMIKLLTDEKLRVHLKRWQGIRVKDFDVSNIGPKIEKEYFKVVKDKA